MFRIKINNGPTAPVAPIVPIVEEPVSPECGYFWHGTSKTPPEKIYNGEEGFNQNFSNDGMWGRGLYFAENASYSDNYAYKLPDGSKGMFLA